jgi:hypothetical protein
MQESPEEMERVSDQMLVHDFLERYGVYQDLGIPSHQG